MAAHHTLNNGRTLPLPYWVYLLFGRVDFFSDMKLKYIKASGKYYRPQRAGEQDPNKVEGCYYPVCIIKKLSFGRWQIDYYDEHTQSYENDEYGLGDENKPTTRLIIYPNGIEEIRWQL